MRRVEIFVRGRFQGSYHYSKLKFGMRSYVYEYNRNIIEMYPKYTDACALG